MKKWTHFPYEVCPICGECLEAYTDCTTEGQFYDGDNIKCKNTECFFKSSISVDDGECWVNDEPF